MDVWRYWSNELNRFILLKHRIIIDLPSRKQSITLEADLWPDLDKIKSAEYKLDKAFYEEIILDFLQQGFKLYLHEPLLGFIRSADTHIVVDDIISIQYSAIWNHKKIP